MINIHSVKKSVCPTFKCKVECLSGEISDDIDNISSPEREESLLPVDPDEAVHDPLVSLVGGDPLVGVLDLEQHLDPFQGRNHSLTHCGGDAACNEVEDEVLAHDLMLGYAQIWKDKGVLFSKFSPQILKALQNNFKIAVHCCRKKASTEDVSMFCTQFTPYPCLL